MTRSLFDLRTVFFSRRGSYLGFSHTDRGVPDGVYLRHLRGGTYRPEIFRLECLRDGVPVPFEEILTPAYLRLQAGDGFVEICFESADDLRIRGQGLALRLVQDLPQNRFNTAWVHPDGSVHTLIYSAQIKCRFVALRGSLALEAPWDGMRTTTISVTIQPAAGEEFDCALQTYLTTPPARHPAPTYAEALGDAQADFDAWHAATLPVPVKYEAGRELAAYINWASVVQPRENLTRPAMLMSKNWMSKIWSWDNCFNAIAHVEQDPQLAWDQIMLFFDHQQPDGSLPDSLSDQVLSLSFYKPPVVGWAVRHMLARSNAITDAHLQQVYPGLCRWTEWWFTHRDDDADGIPQYNHGNESGWDNGTVFAARVPVESPDLATHLILQMDFLADTAGRLGREQEAAAWRQRAEELYRHLIDELWTGDQFIARHAFTHEGYPGDSLLVWIPILLGERLPADMRVRLIAGIRRFMTPHGPATEQPDSRYYEADGYWRGPIWAPSTYMIVDGLLRCGEMALALEISRRFCEMAARSGMAENYDALTGAGLRDRAYTWTSGVFLLLGNLLLHTPVHNMQRRRGQMLHDAHDTRDTNGERDQ